MGGWLRAVVVMAAVLAAVPAASVFAAVPAAAEERTLVVGVEEIDYLPAYGWRDGAYTGAAREILDAFAAESGYRMVYRPLPIKRLYAQLVHHEIDLKFPDNPIWAPALKDGHQVAYSAPVIRYTDGVMVPADKPAPAVGDIKALGIVAGFTPAGWQDRIAAGSVAIKETARVDLAVRQVLRGLTDGVYVSVAVAHRILADLGRPDALAFAAGLPHANGGYSLSSDSHPEVIKDFDAWLVANAGRVQAIKDRTGAERGIEK
jgi:ABC-type amino acid transport substrate-binding protein